MLATKEFQRIKSTVEKIRNNDTQRFPDAASAGDYFRQGDIYVTLRDGVAERFTIDPKPAAQLAPGTTQGSRHILDSLTGVTMYRDKNGDALQGPLLVTTEERTITHPEHGHVVLPPGCYEITYQRAYADELRRVQD